MPFLFSFLLSFLSIADTKIAWTTPTQHDFGQILRGKEASFVFTFQNLSDKPLTIDNVRTDCSCTTSDWEAAPILPKEIGKIKVSFDTHQKGFFRKKLTVWVHGQRKSEKLSIEGEVVE